MTDEVINKGKVSDRTPKRKVAINYKDTWGRESGRQPGLMLEVLNMGRAPFKKIGS